MHRFPVYEHSRPKESRDFTGVLYTESSEHLAVDWRMQSMQQDADGDMGEEMPTADVIEIGPCCLAGED